MSGTLWATKARSNVQKLLDSLLPAVSGSDIRIQSLATYIAIEELLATLPPAKAHRGLLVGAVARAKHLGKPAVGDLEELYAAALGKREETDSDVLPWTFYIPVRVQTAESVSLPVSFTVMGVDVEFVAREIAGERMGNAQVLGDGHELALMLGKRRWIEDLPEIYLTFHGVGKTWQQAWANVGPIALDSFRGLIELVHGYHGWRAGTETPRSKIPLYGWMLVSAAHEPVEAVPFITDSCGDYVLKPFRLDETAVKAIQRHLEPLVEKPKGQKATLGLIGSCLQLYSEAMDATWNYRCLLALWQLAEALTLSESFGGETKTVVSRLARFGAGKGLSGSGYRHVLRRIADTRNDIVHRGQYSGVRDEYVNILKLACEDGLGWLLNNHRELPTTHHVEMYYRFCDVNDADLEGAKQAIAFIEEHER